MARHSLVRSSIGIAQPEKKSRRRFKKVCVEAFIINQEKRKMPMPFFEMPSDYDPRERRDEDMKCGGVAEPRWFNITVTFQTLADAMASKAGFEEAGYKFELLDEIDEYSNAAFVTISRPAGSVSMDELFQQARAVADELKGDADGAWISPKINHDYDAS